METTDHFTDEWNALQKRRRELAEKSEKLKRRINGFPNEKDDPEIVRLLQEKNHLKKDVENLQREIHMYQDTVVNRMGMIKNCQLVLVGKQPQSEFNRVRNNFLQLVEKARKGRKPISPAGLQFADDMQKSIAMSLPQIVTCFELHNAYDQRSKQFNQRIMDELNLHIGQIEENFRQTKKCLRQEDWEVKRKGETHCQKILDWITSDREHLTLALEKDSSYQSAALQHWKKRWPNDTLEGTPYALNQTPVQQNGHPYLGRAKASPSPTSPNQPVINCPKPWGFFIAKRDGSLGPKVSLEISEFSKEMEPYLEHDLGGLKPESVYKKLIEPITSGAHPRQLDVKPVKSDKFPGWVRLGIAGDYRILLLTEEELRRIRFFPYSKNNEPF